MSDEHIKPASELLQEIVDHDGDSISLHELIENLHEGSFAIVLMLFALPVALPMPAPGYGTIFAIPLLFIILQMVIGRRTLFIPEKMGKKQLSLILLRKALSKINPLLRKTEYLVKPRLRFISSRGGYMVVGIAMAICAICISLPFPLTNTLPAMGIFVMSIGLLQRDGLVCIGGILLGFTGCALAAAVYKFGYEVVKAALGMG